MKKILLIFIIVLYITLFSCSNNIKTTEIINKFKTEYRIYYSIAAPVDYTIYTDSETCVCSFNGTNYLLEKGNGEELVSTTAPIRILKITKIDENGKETEYTKPY